jgi:hypothetical protein
MHEEHQIPSGGWSMQDPTPGANNQAPQAQPPRLPQGGPTPGIE